MPIGGHAFRVAAGTLALMVAMSLTPALAAVGDLTSGLLRAGEAPAGFLAAHHTTYAHYHHIMRVTVSHGARKEIELCYTPVSISSYGWMQGVIEAFDTRSGVRPFRDFRICAWRLRTVRGAQNAYRSLTLPLQSPLRKKQLKPLTGSRIGDESLAVVASPRATGYGLLFRRANAVLEVTYLGPQSLRPATFLHLGGLVNSRLR